MDAVEYVGQSVMRVAMLPSRVAYLIRADSVSGLRRAIQEASSRWGGMAEPIVTVNDDGSVDDWFRQVIELADVRALVNVDVDSSLATSVAAMLGLDLVPLANIDKPGTASHWTCNPVQVPRDYDPATNSTSIATEGGDLWEAVAAGDLTEDVLVGMRDGTRYPSMVPVRPRSADALGWAQLWEATLLDRTVDQFREHSTQDQSANVPIIVFVVESNDFSDCLSYWNLRALRSFLFNRALMAILPVDDVQHWLNFGESFRSRLVRPEGVVPDVVIVSTSVSNDRLDEFAAMLGLERTTEPTKISRIYSQTEVLRSEPFTYKLNLDVRHLFVFGRRYGEVVATEAHVFHGRATALRFPSPIPFAESTYVLLQFGGEVLDELPKRQEVANHLVRNGRWQGDWLEIATVAQREYRLELQIPALSRVVELLLTSNVLSFKLSDKGKLATGLIARTELDGLLSPGVYEAAIELMTPRSKELLRELRRARENGSSDEDLVTLASNWGGRPERRIRHAGQLTSALARGSDALERLCALGWAGRGLEVSCGQCGMNTFVPLASVTGDASCPGCGSKERYSAGDVNSPLVFYRLDTLVDRAADQGVLPHLLVLAALRREGVPHYVLPGIDVIFFDGSQAEVDIYGVVSGKVVAGEVKTSAAEFTDDQLRRDVSVTKKLGADVYLLASTTDIPSSVSDFATELCIESAVELRVMGPKDLRPSGS